MVNVSIRVIITLISSYCITININHLTVHSDLILSRIDGVQKNECSGSDIIYVEFFNCNKIICRCAI